MDYSVEKLDQLIKEGSWWATCIGGLIIVFLVLLLLCVLFWPEKVKDLLSLGTTFGIPILSISVLTKTNALLTDIKVLLNDFKK